MKKEDLLKALEKVGHPAINYSLVELGILRDIELYDKRVSVVFAFPFPDIPIADRLINSVAQYVKSLGLDFICKVRVMTEKEKMRFFQLEKEAWKGL